MELIIEIIGGGVLAILLSAYVFYLINNERTRTHRMITLWCVGIVCVLVFVSLKEILPDFMIDVVFPFFWVALLIGTPVLIFDKISTQNNQIQLLTKKNKLLTEQHACVNETANKAKKRLKKGWK